MAELTSEQKVQVTQWVDEGCGLSEIQKRLSGELGVAMTYMDVRFLVLDLGLTIKEREVPAAPELTIEDDPAALGGLAVEVDRLTKPGALVSGTVVFSDGVNANWSLDQLGRLAIDSGQPDYRPSEEDIAAFQARLREVLETRGL